MEENKKRHPGRPKLSIAKTKVTMSFNPQFLDDLDTMCAFSGKTRSQIVEDIVWASYETFMDSVQKNPKLVAIIQKRSSESADNVLVVERK